MIRALWAVAVLWSASSPALAEENPWAHGQSGALACLLSRTAASLPLPLEARGAHAYRWRDVAPAAIDGVTTRERVRDERVTLPSRPGIYHLEIERPDGSFRPVGLDVIARVHFDYSTPTLNHYRIGRHLGLGRAGSYAPPEDFIEVTPENVAYRVSAHLSLGDFLTHDQAEVWPKYVPLQLRLVDKLERIAQLLALRGLPAHRLHVMSGYRTPSYNGPGGRGDGRARYSRHTYGDAADVWIDDDGDGRMDDLNHDGRVDDKDAEVLAKIADEISAKSPELAGGAGIYRATSAHGPFTHIDVRGSVAHWARR